MRKHYVTIKQEIKALKVGEEKIFKVHYASEYITIRKSKLKGLEIIIDDGYGVSYEISYEEVRNNFTDYSFYQGSKIDY